MMDALLAYLPDGTDVYWAILCAALAVLNVWQFARTRDLSGTLGLLFKHGHAPEGKVLVPSDSVTAKIGPLGNLVAHDINGPPAAQTGPGATQLLRPGQPPPPPWEQPK